MCAGGTDRTDKRRGAGRAARLVVQPWGRVQPRVVGVALGLKRGRGVCLPRLQQNGKSKGGREGQGRPCSEWGRGVGWSEGGGGDWAWRAGAGGPRTKGIQRRRNPAYAKLGCEPHEMGGDEWQGAIRAFNLTEGARGRGGRGGCPRRGGRRQTRARKGKRKFGLGRQEQRCGVRVGMGVGVGVGQARLQ